MSDPEIIKGYEEFYRQYFSKENSLYKKLSTEGQSPKTLIIACCDSRVDPSIITQAEPGELFVIRNIANLVPPFEKDNGLHGVSAALEFAVRILKVEHIIILGHSQCAGVEALTNNTVPDSDFIQPWVNMGMKARQKTIDEISQNNKKDDIFDDNNHLLEQHMPKLEQGIIKMSLENLLTFTWINDEVKQGSLSLHGWYFDVKSGELMTANHPNMSFIKHDI